MAFDLLGLLPLPFQVDRVSSRWDPASWVCHIPPELVGTHIVWHLHDRVMWEPYITSIASASLKMAEQHIQNELLPVLDQLSYVASQLSTLLTRATSA